VPPDPWQWGWPAVEAIATVAGVVLAATAAVFAYLLNREQLRMLKLSTERVGVYRRVKPS
jgi:hypothetical protein